MKPEELGERQRQTLGNFWQAESRREQSEKKEGEKLAATTDATRNQAEAATSEAKQYLGDAHQTQEDVHKALQQVGLSTPAPRSPDSQKESGPPLILLKNAVSRIQATAHEVNQGILGLSEAWRRVRIRRIALAVGVGILALVLLIIHLGRLQSQQTSRNTPPLGKSPVFAHKIKLIITEETDMSGDPSYILVNGKPNNIEVGHINYLRPLNFRNNPWAKNFPKANSYNRIGFKKVEQLSGGGQRFIFQFLIQDGCRGCDPLGSAHVAYDFAESGLFLGTKILKFTNETEYR